MTVTIRSARSGGDSIHIHTRGVLGVLSFVSAGVDVPDAHRKAGLAAGSTPSRSPRDSSAPTDEPLQLHVRAASKRPSHVALAVPHRDTWFFIDDADLHSKATFALLAQIYALQAAPASTGVPTLTLPAGR